MGDIYGYWHLDPEDGYVFCVDMEPSPLDYPLEWDDEYEFDGNWKYPK